MAKVIDRYHAKAGGSSAMYYYEYADNTSKATRIYTGTVIYLHRNYTDRITSGMYLMVDPSGWIPWYYVQDIEPVYVTVTDPCTAPEKVTLDAASKLLSISGGAGGDLNAWTGFGVSWRKRAINSTEWDAWSEDEVTASRSVPVSTDSGTVRQYRVRTLGEAGSSYYSDYVVCDTLLNGNTAAGTPAVLLPVSGLATWTQSPVFKIECPPEPDGEDMILQRSLDGGEWTDAASLTGAGGVVWDTLTAPEGAHKVRYRLMDANGVSGGEDSITFTREPAEWTREIHAGDVIANREISFVRDLTELTANVNRVLAFYGMNAVILPGVPGRIVDWQRQLAAMQNAVSECRTAVGLSDAGFDPPGAWPQASQINQLRTAIENT